VNAVFSTDGSTAYVLNCGAECGGTQASVEILSFSTTPPTVRHIGSCGWRNDWISERLNALCGRQFADQQFVHRRDPTAAATCGRLDVVDLGSMTVTGSAVITDGYHDRIDMGNGGSFSLAR
jgi:hypothetical protein